MLNNDTAQLFVISGASGTGKTTLCRALENELGMFFSVSITTRPKRAGEVEGRDYFFINSQEFQKKIQQGAFLEWAQVHDHYYGTPKAPIEQHLKQGQSVLLDIDTQGALQLKKEHPEIITIFLLPPSMDELRRRLEDRGTDAQEVIEKRIKKAQDEIAKQSQYDFVVTNENFEQAKEEIKGIIEKR